MTRDTDAGTASPLPPPAEAFAGRAKDLQALCDTVVEAASVGAGLWFSYLFVLLYLLITAGGVTHRDLFLESPVKLPFLYMDLPLLGFFLLGPLIFLIVHAYVLLHFVLLAGKVGDFDAELRAQIAGEANEELRTRLRRQLPSNIFVQFLAGPHEVRRGVLGFMLQLIAWISLAIGPLVLLVFFELQFLPYHNEAISWLEGEDEMAKVWKAQASSSPGVKLYEKRLAKLWRKIGCVAEDAPYMIRGLLVQLGYWPSPFDEQSPQLPELAKAFEEHCPGARGLTDAEKATLKEIRDRTPPVSRLP
jgi:hypothetical protein